MSDCHYALAVLFLVDTKRGEFVELVCKDEHIRVVVVLLVRGRILSHDVDDVQQRVEDDKENNPKANREGSLHYPRRGSCVGYR